jgi:hypothetical protein
VGEVGMFRNGEKKTDKTDKTCKTRKTIEKLWVANAGDDREWACFSLVSSFGVSRRRACCMKLHKQAKIKSLL